MHRTSVARDAQQNPLDLSTNLLPSKNSKFKIGGADSNKNFVPETGVKTHNLIPTAPTMAVLSDKGRARYLTRTVSADTVKEREEFKQSFAKIQEQVLPESEINTPHPGQAKLAKQMLQNTRRWKCLREMSETTVMETDEPLVIEDKDGELGPPPNRSYKVPKSLLPQLSEFIEDLLKKRFIEPVPQGKGGNAWYSPILYSRSRTARDMLAKAERSWHGHSWS